MRRSDKAPGLFRLSDWLAAFQVLNFYTAAGVASFGWSLAHVLRFRCDKYLPLWFFGTLFIYNLDRLKLDPADRINSPDRTRSMATFRKVGTWVTWFSAGIVLLFPILERDWWLLGLVILAGVVSASYSVALFGARLKTIPVLKTFFVPGLITAAFLAPPLLAGAIAFPKWHTFSVAAWTFFVLLFNVFLCDRRDVRGDEATGIRTLPVILGPRHSRRFGAILYLGIGLLSLALLFQNPASNAWRWILGIMLPSLGLLHLFQERPQTEAFYEWWVGGLLFIPLFGCLLFEATAAVSFNR